MDFNSVPSDPFTNLGGLNPEVTRIKTLIEAIENYGVDKKYLFTVEDLFEKKHIPRVVRCLEEIEKLVKLNETFKFLMIYIRFTGKTRGTCQFCIYACQQGLLLKSFVKRTNCWNFGIPKKRKVEI